MATITISYEGEDLILSDRGNTKAKNNEQIIWSPGRGVHSVTSVTVKTNSPISTENFWSEAPQQNGAAYKGTINNSIKGDWEYDITCNVGTPNNPVQKTEDPRIQVLST